MLESEDQEKFKAMSLTELTALANTLEDKQINCYCLGRELNPESCGAGCPTYDGYSEKLNFIYLLIDQRKG